MSGYADDDLLPLSGIQHIAFCERQWALIYLERIWRENLHTVEGKLVHKRVHEDAPSEKRGDVLTLRSVPLLSRHLGLYGVADVVEFLRASDANTSSTVKLPNHLGYWMPRPVEYKRGREKPDDRDEVQLCAQAICLEEMLSTSIAEGCLFYARQQGRVTIEFTPALRSRAEELASLMHRLFEASTTPPPPAGKRCGECSLVHHCVPGIRRGDRVRDYIARGVSDMLPPSEGVSDAQTA